MLNKTVHLMTRCLLARNRFQSVLQFVRKDEYDCVWFPHGLSDSSIMMPHKCAFVNYSRPSRLRMPLSSKFTVRLDLPAFPIEPLYMLTLLSGQAERDVRFKFFVAEMPECGQEVSWQN